MNDGHEDSAPDTVTISTVNSPPVANAGSDQSVAVGATVTLDGSDSKDVDGDPLTYLWSLDTVPTGSKATLANPTTRTPSFTVDKAGTYIIALVVNDGAVDSAPDYVVVTTLNSKPVADAGADQTAKVGGTVTLNGSGSTDADGDPLTYHWSFNSRPGGSDPNLNTTNPVEPTLSLIWSGCMWCNSSSTTAR